MKSRNVKNCLFCGQSSFQDVFDYNAPPMGETVFPFLNQNNYQRKMIVCEQCGHFYSTHQMDLTALYSGEYNHSTYKDINGMRQTFDRIVKLDFSKSDNYGRCNRIESFLKISQPDFQQNNYKILDVGSGLGIFPYEMSKRGYSITALDPDPQSIEHIQSHVKVPSLCANFMEACPKEQYQLITFNKVLEHVENPIEMLKKASSHLGKNGLLYVELPDGEMAQTKGAGREEFFIDHLHVFSFNSISLLASRANLIALQIERIREPSSKFTLRAFMTLGLANENI